MLKRCVTLAALAGSVLLIGGCSQQTPMSAKSGGFNSVGTAVGGVSELKSVADANTGRLYFIMTASNGTVYYKYQNADGTWPTGWTNTGYTAASNIVTLQGGNVGGIKVTWVFFKDNQNRIICLATSYPTPNDPPLQYYSWSTGFGGTDYVTWNTNSQLAGVIPQGGGNPLLYGRMSDNKLYSYCPTWGGVYFLKLSDTTVGYCIAADTLSSGYGTNGFVRVFAVSNDGYHSLLTMAQTSFHSGSGVNYSFGTWPSTYTNLGGILQYNVVVGRNLAGYLEVFGCNGACRINHIYQTGASTWSAWSQMPNCPQTFGSISGERNADGRLELFYTVAEGGKDTVYHQWQTAPNSSWSNPTALKGSNGVGIYTTAWFQYTSNVYAARWGAVGATSGRILYGFSIKNTDPTDSIYTIKQVAENGSWTNWTSFY